MLYKEFLRSVEQKSDHEEESQEGAEQMVEDDAQEEEPPEIQNKGTRYYGVLLLDRLKLFEDEDCANRHLDQEHFAEEWENRPKEVHMIYRMSKEGLISDNFKEQSFTLMVQDNICKMQNIKIKITIENEKEKK